MKYFPYVAIGAVAAVLIAGFVFVGLPSNERARQFDERRVNDLQQIQSQVVEYWQRHGELPPDLTAIQKDIADSTLHDPVTGEAYRYEPAKPGTRTNASTTYFLCATFASEHYVADDRVGAPGSVTVPTQRLREQWDHAAGTDCFERTIDPSQYPPAKQPLATGGCLITGCSGQVCAEAEVVTTCEFQPQYACYKQYSKCERQTNGQCGWTHTAELSLCLYGPPPLPKAR